MLVGSVCIPLSARQRPVDKQEAFLGLRNQVPKYKRPPPNTEFVMFAEHSELAPVLLNALVLEFHGWDHPSDILLHVVTCS